MFKFSFLIFFIAICTLANEGAEPEAGTTMPDKEFSGSQTQKWSEVQAELSQLKSKIDAQTKTVEELLLAQKHNEGKVSSVDILKLKKEHEKLHGLTTDYNEMLADFQFRFPEKGLESGRKYIRLENQTLEQIENAPTFEARLKKLNRKIKHQFQVVESDEKTKKKPTYKTEKIPAGSKGLDSKNSNEPAVTDQINLVK
jgi:predicted GIY-YIG superfamily endonuclease